MKPFGAHVSDFVTRLCERWPYGLIFGIILFALDWSGYNRWEPDLFFPRPIAEVYWHLPLEVAACVLVATLWPRD